MNTKNQEWTFYTIEKAEWSVLWSRVEFPCLTQSWEYGEAKRREGWKPYRYVLKDPDGNSVGVMQVLDKSLPLLGGVARINRGPLMMSSDVRSFFAPQEVEKIAKAVKKISLRKRWWYTFYSPDLNSEPEYKHALVNSGYKHLVNKTAQGSIKLSLKPEVDELLKGQKGKWRNLLRKAEKMELLVEEVNDEKMTSTLLDIYQKFQKDRGFVGVSIPLLRDLLTQEEHGNWKCRILRTFTKDNDASTGFVIIVEHGNCATYLVGWTCDLGRKQQANYLLIWKAIQAARENGLDWFDMGGVTENTPKGIAHFKQGIGGEQFVLAGEFGGFPIC